MQTVLITGANRGFGYEFARQYLKAESVVFATCRDPQQADSLQALHATYPNHLHLIPLEAGDEAAIHAAYRTVRQHTDHLDILVNNAGMGYGAKETRHLDQLGTLTMESQMRVLQVNAVAPLILAQTFLPLLKRSRHARIVNISSWLGSIKERTPDYYGSFAYSASKSALNMYSRILGFALAEFGIIVVALDPGWARTDMGGEDADQAVDETVTAMIERIAQLTPADSSQFLLWSGGHTEW
jgi:NAD(P)-dependent dehydrogenase (short-subunit alcohol dehydrogenase family)